MNPHRLGPGKLTFGATGSETEFGALVTNARAVPTANDGETINFLSGDEFIDSGDETWAIEGTLHQDYGPDSLALWAFENSGETVPFTFVPNNANALRVTGNVLVRSIQVGGDVKTRNTSDFSFPATNVDIDANNPTG